VRVSIPRKALGNHRGVDRIEPQTLGITGALRVLHVAVQGYAPGEQWPSAYFGWAATAHSVSDESASILGHRALDLEQELIMWVLTHRPRQKLDRTASLDKFAAEEPLVDIVRAKRSGAVMRTNSKAAKAARSR
jgi:hypothetical protein